LGIKDRVTFSVSGPPASSTTVTSSHVRLCPSNHNSFRSTHFFRLRTRCMEQSPCKHKTQTHMLFSDVLQRPIFSHCFYFQFNIWTFTHNISHQRSPPYLKDLVTFSVSGPQRRQLRSSAATSAVVRLSSIDELFLSADKTFGIVCLLI